MSRWRTFGWAMMALEAGADVRRKTWPHGAVLVRAQPTGVHLRASRVPVPQMQYATAMTAVPVERFDFGKGVYLLVQGRAQAWTPSQEDMLTDDWEALT